MITYRYTTTAPVTYVLSGPTGSARTAFVVDGKQEKIRSFSRLPIGWHFGSGNAPSSDTIATALAWHGFLIRLGFTVTDAFPGAQGEIMVTAYEGPHYIELLLEADNSVSLIYELNSIELTCLEQATAAQILSELEAIAGGIWNTSAYSIQTFLTVNATSSRALHSKSMMTGLRSSTLRVSPGEASANISEHIIPTSVVSPRYFGNLMTQSYPRVPA
jgi:hypothetical protein